MTECGYTPSEIGVMTLHDVKKLFNHWRRMPPLRVLVAACASALGVKLPNQTKTKPMTADEFQRMVRATGGRIEGVGSA